MIQRGTRFSPDRYIGYDHFLQDQLRHYENIVKSSDGQVISTPTYYNENGKWKRSTSREERR